MIAVTDRVLLERWIARRDAGAFNEIVSRYTALVYGISKRLLRNEADAEDTTQSCFLKLARAPAPPRTSLPGWLHATATRAALDTLRARSRRTRREKEFARGRSRERTDGETLEELKEHIDECIAQLPEELREVIVLHFLERKTQEAVATALGVSRQTVSYRTSRGIERLRVLLRKKTFAVTGASLSAFLGGSMAEAAPPAVLASLGRIALAGPSIATSAAPAATVLLVAKIGAFIMAKKLFLSGLTAAALMALLGIVILRAPASREQVGAPASREARISSGEASAARVAAAPPSTPGEPETPGAGEDPAAEGAVAPPSSLAGKVFDSQGRAVSGALVIAAAPGAERLEKLDEAASDASGAFRLSPPVRPDLAVYAYRKDVGLGAGSGEAMDLQVVLEPLSGLSGRLYDKETAGGVAGVRLSLRGSSASPGVSPEAARLHRDASGLFPDLAAERLVAVSDDDGRFAYTGLGPLSYALTFDPSSSEYVLPGYRREDYEPEVRLEPGERRSGLDYALEKGGSISGTVSGPGGAPLPGAQVEVLASYLTVSRRVAWCDGQGAYRFTGLLPGSTYSIGASHEGFPPGESSAVGMPAAESIEGVDIHLSHGHSASGRLADDLGQPLPGVPIALFKVSDSDRRGIQYPEQVTGDDGTFSFVNVAPGKHAIQARSAAHSPGEPLGFVMPPDRDLPGIELALRRKAAGYISGRVVDHDGAPVAGFPVNAMLGSKAVAAARSGEDGAFVLEGLGDAGAYTVTGYSGEYWSSRQLAVPLYATDVMIVAMRRGRIAGRVIDEATREPIEHFEVRAVFIRTEAGGGENRFHLKWIPYDSKTGQFLIDGAEPVDCEVQVRADGYIEAKSARFAIPPGEAAGEVVVALSRGASVKGTVIDAETGEPVAGALVRAHQHEDFFPGLLEEGRPSYAPRGVWKLAMSGAEGGFEVPGLSPEDTIHLVAWKEGYAPAVKPGLLIGRRGSIASLSLARAATLVITARFEPQASERHEIHLLHRAEKPWRQAFRASVELGEPGVVEVPGLPPGSYRLVVCAAVREGKAVSRRLLGEERLEVSRGKRQRITIDVDELSRGFGSVLVQTSGRSAPEDLRLHIVSADDDEEVYAFGPMAPGPQGRVRFTGLPPGKYVVIGGSATMQPPLQKRLPLELAEGQHLEVELTIE